MEVRFKEVRHKSGKNVIVFDGTKEVSFKKAASQHRFLRKHFGVAYAGKDYDIFVTYYEDGEGLVYRATTIPRPDPTVGEFLSGRW